MRTHERQNKPHAGKLGGNKQFIISYNSSLLTELWKSSYVNTALLNSTARTLNPGQWNDINKYVAY